MSISTVDDIASALANNRKPSRFAKVFPAPKAAGSMQWQQTEIQFTQEL